MKIRIYDDKEDKKIKIRIPNHPSSAPSLICVEHINIERGLLFHYVEHSNLCTLQLAYFTITLQTEFVPNTYTRKASHLTLRHTPA
jgi:hypothetical protein